MMKETLETVISRIHPIPGDAALLDDACAWAAQRVREMTFDGDPHSRKMAMLREGVRLRNERMESALSISGDHPFDG